MVTLAIFLTQELLAKPKPQFETWVYGEGASVLNCIKRKKILITMKSVLHNYGVASPVVLWKLLQITRGFDSFNYLALTFTPKTSIMHFWFYTFQAGS